LIDGGLKICLL